MQTVGAEAMPSFYPNYPGPSLFTGLSCDHGYSIFDNCSFNEIPTTCGNQALSVRCTFRRKCHKVFFLFLILLFSTNERVNSQYTILKEGVVWKGGQLKVYYHIFIYQY